LRFLFEEVKSNLAQYVDAVFSDLQSEFLTLPKGPGFVEYPTFELGYETLKRMTNGFRDLKQALVLDAVYQVPVSFVVLRAMLGFTPPELAYVTTQRSGVTVDQGAARNIDKKVRTDTPMKRRGGLTDQRIEALVRTAVDLLTEGAPEVPEGILHRLQKADTASGIRSIQPLAEIGVPYAMLLYERFLGRPFAGHRDTVSGLVGDVLEATIEQCLHHHGISFRKTRRVERVEGFDQAPDFIVPDEFNPQVVIEAKITEDDGTARDKITRVQHLGALSMVGRTPDQTPRFEVVACIAGRGFKVRREDMKKLLFATRGKVFTLKNIGQLMSIPGI
jgi:hypothetical protein